MGLFRSRKNVDSSVKLTGQQARADTLAFFAMDMADAARQTTANIETIAKLAGREVLPGEVVVTYYDNNTGKPQHPATVVSFNFRNTNGDHNA